MPPETKTLSAPSPTHQGKRERSKAANREAILDAARVVFAELGYEATTVRDIIRHTKLASGTFYNYFKSKEEIFEALVKSTVLEFGQILSNLRSDDIAFSDYLRCAFQAYFQYLVDKHEEVLKLASPNLGPPTHMIDTPEMRAIFQEIRKDFDQTLKSEGFTGIDTAYLTASAIGIARELGNYMLARIVTHPGGQHVEDATDFATNLLLSGVRHVIAEKPA